LGMIFSRTQWDNFFFFSFLSPYTGFRHPLNNNHFISLFTGTRVVYAHSRSVETLALYQMERKSWSVFAFVVCVPYVSIRSPTDPVNEWMWSLRPKSRFEWNYQQTCLPHTLRLPTKPGTQYIQIKWHLFWIRTSMMMAANYLRGRLVNISQTNFSYSVTLCDIMSMFLLSTLPRKSLSVYHCLNV
jgi:hypothetical protein